MAQANREDVRRELTRLLGVIFAQNPVHQTPEYLTSALSQFRRTLLDADRPHDSTSQVPLRLATWLDEAITIGPYERTLLYRIFDKESDKGVVTIRGGSGSGKSSTFQHIDRACADAAAKMEWRNPYGLKRFFLLIDLQSTCGEIHPAQNVPAEDDTALLVGAVDILLRDLVGILDDFFTRELSLDGFRQLIKDAIAVRVSARYTNLGSVQTHIERAFADKDIASLKLDDLIRTLNELKEGELLRARLLLLTQLARGMKFEGDGRMFIVVLDNVDPLPVHVQNQLIKVLEAAASTPLWSPLKVVVLARLSTAAHRLGAVAPVIFDHECVDAADVVLYRITWFFLAMRTFSTFALQDEAVRTAVVSRIVELWRHLLDRRGSVRRLLSAMAGTNLRNAFTYATAFCCSSKFIPEAHGAADLEKLTQNVQLLFAVHLVAELDASLGRIAAAQFTKEEMEEFAIAAELDSLQVASELKAQRLVDSMIALLKDLYLFADTTVVADESHIRHQSCIVGRALLADVLLDQDSRHRVAWQLHLALSNAFKRLSTYLALSEGSSSAGELVVVEFTARLQAAVAQLQAHEAAIEGTIAAWIIETARDALSQPITERDAARRVALRETFDSQTKDRIERAAFEPVTSRFQAESIIIDPGTIEGIPGGANALNVFTLDRGKVCHAILRLLYLLDARGRATVRELYGDMMFHGFLEGDVYTALRRMAQTSARLIYASLSDANDDINPWLLSDREVFLSSAGRGYVRNVIASTAYIQWAFGDIAAIRQVVNQRVPAGRSSLIDRVDAALVGFDYAIGVELSMLKNTWKPAASQGANAGAHLRALVAEELPCHNVTADVFFKSYSAFAYAMLAHRHRLGRDAVRYAKDIARLRGLGRQWREIAQRWMNQHDVYFGFRYEEWQLRFDSAEDELREVIGA
jgi:hypothetical protein